MKTTSLHRLKVIAILSLLAWHAGAPQAVAQRFVLISSNGVAANSMAVVAADVNGDGKVDLISADYGGNTLTVLTNRGNGTFAGSSTNVVGTAPRSVVAVDVNGDGWLDLASANDGDNTLTVLTNNGNGTFTFSATLPVGTRPGAIAAADVNGDGKADLICANFNDNTLTVLTNNGKGTFTSSSTLPVGFSPWSVAAADVSGDGKVDLISANYIGGSLTVLTNRGAGRFTLSATPGTGGSPMSVLAADVNGDGKLDLISADFNGGSLTVLTNDGTGRFGFAVTLPVGPNPSSVAAADFNGDDRVDLISANSGGTLSVLINIGNGAFTLSTPPTVGGSLQCVVAADVNGDGRPDLICSVGNSLVVLSTLPSSPTTTPPAYDFTIGSSAGLKDPRGLAVDRGGDLYVADTGNNRIVKFNSRGAFVMTWGGAGNTDGQFSSPLGIALDSSNNVYVSDLGNSRIQKFTSNGAYVTQWACTNPVSLAVDSRNQVYVSAAGIEAPHFSPWTGYFLTDYVSGVWKFASDGTVLQQWPLNTTPFAEAAYWGSGGWGVGGLTMDHNDNIYVAFSYYYRDPQSGWAGSWSGAGIEKTTANGAYVSAWGSPAPDGMAVDGANHLYVADMSNNRLAKFTSTGTLLAQWGIVGGDLGPLSGPRGMAMDRSGNFLYVADSGNNRILVFAFRPTLDIQSISANTAVASWSTAAIGFRLQTTTSLTPPVTWVDVTNAPTLAGGHFTITNAAPGGTHIFRLVKP